MIESVLFLAISGLTLGCVIGFATKVFSIDTDFRIEKTQELLPGANCGGCGFAGCAEFAKILVAGNVEVSKCPVSSADDRKAIEKLLGIDSFDFVKNVALVKCCGDNKHSPLRAKYNGINDCNAAVLVAGSTKACPHGCIGFASCSHACPFNAIEITDLGIAIVHPEICVGCGKCVVTCPRDLILLVPESAEAHILCNSPEKAPIQKKNCTKGCIGCRKCLKLAGTDSIEMSGFLAKIKYETPPSTDIVDVCPVKCIKPKLGLKLSPDTSKKGEI